LSKSPAQQKAYVIAFVLTMKQVLASDNGSNKSHKLE